jgi:hypothetical protein
MQADNVSFFSSFVMPLFDLAIFLPHPILLLGGRKAPKRNMLAAATAGLAKNQIA